MTVRRRESEGVVFLDVSGEYFGGTETQVLERALEEELERGGTSIVLDLSGCRAINSTAYGVLIEARRAFERRGGTLELCGARGRVKSLLDVLRAETLFEIHATEADALASFATRATA